MSGGAVADRSDAVLAAMLAAVDPWRLGGIAVRCRAGPGRDAWLAAFGALLAPTARLRRLPIHTDDSRLSGGIDLAATLATGRPVAERGLLAETDGGVLVVPMAERMPAALAARLGRMLDTGMAADASFAPARVGLIALDEGIDDDERLPVALAERLAFWIAPSGTDENEPIDGEAVRHARALYPDIRAGDDMIAALGATALALGVSSLRASVLALRAARAAAALDGCSVVEPVHAALAARLVLAPRATRLPAPPPPAPATAPQPDQTAPSPPDAAAHDSPPESVEAAAPADIVLAAAQASIPAGLLDRLRVEGVSRARTLPAGQAGARQMTLRRGRPAGTCRGKPRSGARLAIIDTLRAAVPWQRLRTRPATADPATVRLAIRSDDLRITRFEQRTQTTTIFVVDASGSLAASRLAEAKGAVEMLLVDCYVRRDEVALIAFRGAAADLLLPPTRSLARAKRSLADLPGGGATPLAHAIDAATLLADQTRRRGRTAVVVFLTDGRANVGRDGTTGRAAGNEDALQAARRAVAAGLRSLLIDTAPRPQPSAQTLATALRAVYLPLPRADAAVLSQAVRAAAPG